MITGAVCTPIAPAERASETLAEELNALRGRTARIADELAALYRRVAELQKQVTAHQQRHDS